MMSTNQQQLPSSRDGLSSQLPTHHQEQDRLLQPCYLHDCQEVRLACWAGLQPASSALLLMLARAAAP